MRKTKGRSSKPAPVTTAQAVRDVLIKAMTTGQLVPITISIVLMIAACRMPAEEIGKIANRILDGFVDHSLIGYILAVIIVLGWAWHAAMMRRCFSSEARRIGMEKTHHQQARTQIPLGTSDK